MCCSSCPESALFFDASISCTSQGFIMNIPRPHFVRLATRGTNAGETPRFGMTRREFIMLLSSAAVTWPSATRAERSPVPVIGLLGSDAASAQSEWTDAFLQRLRELGWSEGRNIIIDYRWGEGHAERFSEIAAEFVQRKVTLILTHTTSPTLAAKQATSTIPIVFATAGDPIGAGIVPSLARPGGNVTGLSSQTPDAAGKRLELSSRSCPVCVDWQLWPTSIIPTPPSISVSSMKPPVLSGSRSSILKSDEAKS